MTTGWKGDRWTSLSRSPRDTAAIGRAIGSVARSGDLIGLIGELGAGKTQLTRGLAGALGAAEDEVNSPTFVLIHEYAAPAGLPVLVHVDAYRVSNLDELESIGWDPAAGGGELRQEAVVVVEWADRLDGALGDDWLEVRLDHAAVEHRLVNVIPRGRWVERCGVLAAALDAALAGAAGPAAAARPCPICRKPVDDKSNFFPFCSDRCKTIDLAKWAQGDYRISRSIEQADLDKE